MQFVQFNDTRLRSHHWRAGFHRGPSSGQCFLWCTRSTSSSWSRRQASASMHTLTTCRSVATLHHTDQLSWWPGCHCALIALKPRWQANGFAPESCQDGAYLVGLPSATTRLQACTADSMLLRRSGVTVQPSRQVHDLGVIVDSDLSLAAHISHVMSVCFFYIRQLCLIRRSLTTDAALTLVHALIHSCLDYFNRLFAGLPDNQLTRLQSVLRAAARLVIWVPSRAPVSAAVRDVLHWLNCPQRVMFKLCLLTYECLHSLAPEYLSRSCVLLTAVLGRSQLLLSWRPTIGAA